MAVISQSVVNAVVGPAEPDVVHVEPEGENAPINLEQESEVGNAPSNVDQPVNAPINVHKPVALVSLATLLLGVSPGAFPMLSLKSELSRVGRDLDVEAFDRYCIFIRNWAWQGVCSMEAGKLEDQ